MTKSIRKALDMFIALDDDCDMDMTRITLGIIGIAAALHQFMNTLMQMKSPSEKTTAFTQEIISISFGGKKAPDEPKDV